MFIRSSISHARRLAFFSVAMLGVIVAATVAAGRHGQTDVVSGHAHRTDDASADLAIAWFNKFYELVRDTAGYSPPVAARAYGYLGVTAYESLVHGMGPDGRIPAESTHPRAEPNGDAERMLHRSGIGVIPDPRLAIYRSLAGQLNGLASLPRPQNNRKYHWPTVANAAMQTTAHHFFPASGQAIDDLADGFFGEYEADAGQQVFDRSVDFGVELATAILDWSQGDGFAQIGAANAAFVPPSVSGPWVGTGTGLHPAWGTLRPFAVPSASTCGAKAAPAYSEDPGSAFYAHALVVYNTTGDLGAKLSQEQKDIAHFWSDGPGATGTPPGHWVSIVGIIVRDRELSLGAAAEGYARVGISVVDAFITCWHTKYETYLMRPITYIQNEIDADWTPLLTTPNFPTYTSGHSTQSGATQVVLTDLFGKVAFTDTTHVDRNNAAILGNLANDTRTCNSLFDAAKEAVISRFYGGIHYIFDNEFGFEQGVCVGETILDRVQFRR